jgi:hypothetical protein
MKSRKKWGEMTKKEDREGTIFPPADDSDYLALQFDWRPGKKYQKEIYTQTKAVQCLVSL